MSKAANRTKKNRYAKNNEGRQSISVGEWLEKKYFRNSFPATLKDGVMTVNVNGVEISADQFDKLYPVPVVAHFNHDITGIDNRKSWMYK